MKILIQLFEIILLKRRPADIAYDPTAAFISFMSAVATGYFQIVVAQTFDQPLPFVLAQGVAQALIFYALLAINKHQLRYVQTVTALFGVSAILQLLGLIILKVPVLGVFGLLLTGWNFYLMIIILRDAIDCTIGQSILITIAYHFVIGLLLLVLFPDMFAQMQAMITAQKT